MFDRLTDFSYKRTPKEAFGFYLAYLFFIELIGFGVIVICAVVKVSHFAPFHGIFFSDAEVALVIDSIGMAITVLALSITIMRGRKVWSFGHIILMFLSAFLITVGSFFGLFLALVPLAYLTTQGVDVTQPSLDQARISSPTKGNILALMGVIILTIVSVWHYTLWTPPPQLNDSEVANLVAFLKQNNIQAAVIQDFYAPHYIATWLIKSDGQKIFLYQKSLGECYGIWGTTFDCTQASLGSADAAEVTLLPDQAELRDLTLNKYFNISSYVTGYSINPLWHPLYNEVSDIYGVLISSGKNQTWSLAISPNGKYAALYYSENIPHLGKLQTTDQNYSSSSYSSNGIAQLPANLNFISWSSDSNYMLFSSSSQIATYDVETATTSYSNMNWNYQAYVHPSPDPSFKSFIYPSIFLGETGDNIFWIDFGGDQTVHVLLPQQFKMVGLIP